METTPTTPFQKIEEMNTDHSNSNYICSKNHIMGNSKTCDNKDGDLGLERLEHGKLKT